MTEELMDVDLKRLPVENWKAKLGSDIDGFIPRMVASCHTTRKELVAGLKDPDHEYRFEAQPGEGYWKHPKPGYRMFSKDFGEWCLFTIWHKREYIYHATVQMLNDMTHEEAAFAIYQRWLETRPKTGGSFGAGKSSRFKWKR